MHVHCTPTLILTPAAEENGSKLFVCGAYLGPALQACVCHTRGGMLDWFENVDAAARHAAAQAMDQLLASAHLPARTVAPSMLPAPARAF